MIPITIFYPGFLTANSKHVSYADVLNPSIEATIRDLLSSFPLSIEAQDQIIDASLRKKTGWFEDISIIRSGAPHPILLFSPAGGENRFSSIPRLERIVACGYDVVSIDHPHEGVPTVDSDGHVCMAQADNDDVMSLSLDRVLDAKALNRIARVIDPDDERIKATAKYRRILVCILHL